MDYQGNSKKARKKANSETEETKVVEKLVLETEVVVKKPSLSERFRNVFLGGDVRQVSHYIAVEVLLPAFRNLLVDAATKGVERMVYGDSSINRQRSPYSYNPGPRITYNRPVNRGYMPEPRRANLPDQPNRPSGRAQHNEIVLGSRSDAEMVLERLSDIVDQYGAASVEDLYVMMGLPSNPVDNRWGWESITPAEIRQIREGYLLDLPQAQPLN